MLFGAEPLRRRAPVVADDDDERIARTVGLGAGPAVGGAQAIALIPGFSRSGAAMGGGLLVGLSHKDAARFAFLLATPIILAAAVLKLPELAGSQGNGVRGPALVGALCAAAHGVPLGALPDALLRNADADSVRGLLPLRRHGLRDLLRGDLDAATRSARPRRRRAIAGVSAPRSNRQRQFPSVLPGRFIRASLPRPSTSCAGTIASAARDA